jgi:hypothetical protein
VAAREPTPVAAALAEAAWRQAAQIDSPIDAGREQVAVAGRVASVGWAGLVGAWAEKPVDAWVRAGVCAQSAVAASVAGRSDDAQTWLSRARTYNALAGEWRRPLVLRPLLQAEAAQVAAGPDASLAWRCGVLAAWMATNPAERAWVAGYTAVRMAARTEEPSLPADCAQLMMTGASMGLPYERVDMLILAATVLTASADRKACLQALEAVPGARGETGSLPAPFYLKVRASQAYAALGKSSRARRLLREAEEMLFRGATEETAPWAIYAEGLLANGRADDARQAFLKGLGDAAAKPGFSKRVALSRTMAAMAVSGLKWTDEEVAAAVKAAE